MGLPVTYIDALVVLLFGIVAFVSYKRGFFAALFDLFRLLIGFVGSLIVSKFVVEAIVATTYLPTAIVSLYVQFILFIAIVFFAGKMRKKFDTVVVGTLGRLAVFYRYHRYFALVPSIFVALILCVLLFTVPLIYVPASAIGQSISHSATGRLLTPPLLASSLYNGYLFQLEPASQLVTKRDTTAVNSLLLDAQYDQAVDVQKQINTERQKVGLPVVPEPTIIAQPTQRSQPQATAIPNQRVQPTATPAPRRIEVIVPTARPAPTAQLVSIPDVVVVIPQPIQIATPQPAQRYTDQELRSIEHEVFTLTNAQRAQMNLPEFTDDQNLAAIARAHSKDMANRNYFSHTTPEGITFANRIQLGGISYMGAAENIAISYSAQAVVAAWMNSPGHKATILHASLKNIGIGAVQGPQGTLYFTQDFTF